MANGGHFNFKLRSHDDQTTNLTNRFYNRNRDEGRYEDASAWIRARINRFFMTRLNGTVVENLFVL